MDSIEYFDDDFQQEDQVRLTLKDMLALLAARGFRRASLAVQKANYAVRMYKNVGFEIADENDEEFIMVWVHKRPLG